MKMMDFMKKKVSYKKLSGVLKIIINMNLLFAILTLAYFCFAEKLNIVAFLAMSIFEIIYLIVSFSFVIFGNEEND